MKWTSIFLIIMSVAVAGCQKFVDVDLPINQLNTAAVFASDSKANSAMRGIYSSFNSVLSGSGPFSSSLSTNVGLSSDELEKTSLSGDQQFFFENNLAPDNATNSNNLWGKFYATIYQANNAYENLQKSTGVTPLAKDHMMGEARFLRAWCFFYLVNLYDSVPFTITPDYRVNALLPREDPVKIYKQIREDLLYAQEKAGDIFTKPGARGRAAKWAATALLARVQLYTQNWEDAEKQASTVIESGYFVMDPLDSSFVYTSREAIMMIANAGSNFYCPENTLTGGLTVTNPNYRFSTYLSNAFEAGDLRITQWTKLGANGFRGPFKYKTYSNTQAGARKEAAPVFRLAEQYLIRAEARAMQGKLTGAIADLDSVRRRAGLPLLSDVSPGMDKDAVLAAVAKERMTELFGEYGHRWFDIKRLGQADAILGVRKSKWRHTAALFPIPTRERLSNPNLGQNPGYE